MREKRLTCRLAKDGDLAGVTAKRGSILLNPFETESLILETGVHRSRGVVRNLDSRQEAKGLRTRALDCANEQCIKESSRLCGN